MYRQLKKGTFEYEELYDCHEIEAVINHYLSKDGDIETAWEGTLGYGRILLTASELKPCLVTEVYLTPWTSAHRIEFFDRFEDVPTEVMQQIEEFSFDEEETYSWSYA